MAKESHLLLAEANWGELEQLKAIDDFYKCEQQFAEIGCRTPMEVCWRDTDDATADNTPRCRTPTEVCWPLMESMGFWKKWPKNKKAADTLRVDG